MTEDPIEALLTKTLDRQAADAPTDESLLTGVQARLHRRRTSRMVGAGVLACAAVAVTVIAGTALIHDPAPTGPPPAGVTDIPGWRWESYETVQVQVPDSWKNFVSGPAPCTNGSGDAGPTVGRLDRWTDRDKSACVAAVLPAGERQEYLWFGDVQQPGIKQYDQGWTEETRLVDGVKLSVLSKDDALRRRILDSAIPITGTDHYGCKAFDPLGAGSRVRPVPAGTEDKVGTVESVDVCEYWSGPLVASSQLTGSSALALAKGLADAPTGNPPATMVGCGTATMMPGYGYSSVRTRSYLLKIHGSAGDWQGWVQYTSCFGDRVPFDDGVTRRLITRTTLDLVRTGPHNPATADLIDRPANVTPSPR